MPYLPLLRIIIGLWKATKNTMISLMPFWMKEEKIIIKNPNIEIGDPADYWEDQVLAMTWKKAGQRSIPDLLGMPFPIRTKP
jgi:hypothetical protein